MIELRQTLREATREVHERLHVHPRLKPLADGRIGPDAYRDLLARLYGFHAAVEAAFETAAHLSQLDLSERRKAHLLRSDLLFLGLEAAEIDRLPLCRELPEIGTAAALLGSAYVVEGSTLGGRTLALAVAPMLGGSIDGRRFLLGYGERHGAMWRNFVTVLETAPSTQHNALALAATATFAAFERWMD